MWLSTSVLIRRLTFDLSLPGEAASLMLFPNCGMHKMRKLCYLLLATVIRLSIRLLKSGVLMENSAMTSFLWHIIPINCVNFFAEHIEDQTLICL